MTSEPTYVEELYQQINALRALQSVALDLTGELDLDRLLHKILSSAVQVMGTTAGSLLLHDSSTSQLVFEVIEGGGGEALKHTRIRSDQGIAGAAFSNRVPIIADDVNRDRRFLKGFDQNYGFQTQNLIAVPLIAKGAAIGVLEVMNKTSGERFTEQDKDLLSTFAAQSAIAIENARLYQQVVRERDRILSVEAAVRHDLARNLHDGPAQIISALIMNIRFMQELVQKKPEHAVEELVQLEATAQKALYQVRNLLFDLRPVILETQGLRAALLAYAERLRLLEPFLIEVEVDCLTMHWPPNIEAAIFSIVQEAVSNAKKHAAAHHVWIRAFASAAHVLLTVEDDGRGFDVRSVQTGYGTRGSLGVLNMRERAEIANGQLEIESTPGRGTRITLSLPTPEKAQ